MRTSDMSAAAARAAGRAAGDANLLPELPAAAVAALFNHGSVPSEPGGASAKEA